MRRRVLSTGLLFVAALSGNPRQAQNERTVWDGVYSQEQAGRGATGYAGTCASCHREDLRGDNTAPALIGVSFTFLWGDMSLGALLSKIQTEMPTDRPNSLPTANYIDILAYILEANGFPAGEGDLGPDATALERIRITASPPQP